MSSDFFAKRAAIAVLNGALSNPKRATDIPKATILRINKEPCFIAVSVIGTAKQVIGEPSYLEKSGFTLLSQII